MKSFLSGIPSWVLFFKKCSLADWLSLVLSLVGIMAILGAFGVLWVEANQPSPELESSARSQEVVPDLGQVMVSVTGAVTHPGVYVLQDGDRVAQALEAAGGILVEADPNQVAALNLAEKISDGQQIQIHFPRPVTTNENPTTTSSSTATGISINTASQKELETLPGIGAVRATSIIENRPYSSIEDLVSKEVITQNVFNDLKTLITI